MADRNVTDMALYDRLDKTTQNSINNNIAERNIELKEQDINRKTQLDAEAKRLAWAKLAQEAEDRRLKEKKIDTDREIAYVNKN